MDPELALLLEVCGGFHAAVHAVASLSRAFWRMFLELASFASEEDLYRHRIDKEALRVRFAETMREDMSSEVFELILRRVFALKVGWDNPTEGLTLRHAIAEPLYLARLVLEGVRPDHEIRYSVMREIREFYSCVQSSAVAHTFHVLSETFNHLVTGRQVQQAKAARKVTWDLIREVLPSLRYATSNDAEVPANSPDLFLECCRAVGYITLTRKIGFAEFTTSKADAEYLLSRLFGMTTRIKGLDDLFGGGGLMLVDALPGAPKARISGRAVVTVGQFGSAKSLLSLQMAVEVARKGGAAWVMPLEQSTEDCLYTLESMGCLSGDQPFRVATTVTAALKLLEEPAPDLGALILLRSVKESFDDFLAAFEENVRLMKGYSMRLMIVDPVSALSQGAEQPTEKRARMSRLFEDAKTSGVNIWLVTEESFLSGDASYAQNTADTVIRLFSEMRHGYSQRYIEITKSRLQREQRGRHALAIVPGVGLTVYPSSAAVRARIRMRSERMPDTPIRFGLPALDGVLGDKGIYAGDVILLHGPDGSSKTTVGLSFLLGSDRLQERHTHYRPLLISARDDKATVRHALQRLIHTSKRDPSAAAVRSLEDITILPIGGGYVTPGVIFRQIEDEFLRSRLEERPIGRVVIENIGHWELSCPYIREDETFADTLVDLLRRHRVTTVITSDTVPRHGGTSLQQLLRDHANCLINFEKVAFRGSREMMRVIKTRDMVHRRDSFELVADPVTFEMTAASSLLQMGERDRVTTIEVRLFLHAESDAQTTYNKFILRSIRSILTREAYLATQNFAQSRQALSLGSVSSINELQVLQLDEFQLPEHSNGRGTMRNEFHLLPREVWDEEAWQDVIPRLRERVQSGSSCTALPFYQNIGLLAYRQEVSASSASSWEVLSRECSRWESENPQAQDVFFDFPKVTGENYCALFIEILLWLAGKPEVLQSECSLQAWFTSDHAVKAACIMHRLCQRAEALIHEGGSQNLQQPSPFRVNHQARVWRHWYSTLNQMLGDMLPVERAQTTVVPLPGAISVAGEWFLALPRYSAAPDVGLKIIELYTSPEAEMDRVRYGVGLPVRSSFYRSIAGSSSISVSPYFAMDGKDVLSIIENAFVRSSFACYTRQASMLSTHLKNVLSLPALEEHTLEAAVRQRVNQLRDRLNGSAIPGCSKCMSARDALRSRH